MRGGEVVDVELEPSRSDFGRCVVSPKLRLTLEDIVLCGGGRAGIDKGYGGGGGGDVPWQAGCEFQHSDSAGRAGHLPDIVVPAKFDELFIYMGFSVSRWISTLREVALVVTMGRRARNTNFQTCLCPCRAWLAG